MIAKPRYNAALELFGPAEQTHVDSLAEDVSLDRLDQLGARHESVGAGLHIEFGVQREEFKCVVVARSRGRRSGAAAVWACSKSISLCSSTKKRQTRPRNL